jgi:nicotinate-nucleotide adenylyltransferase
MAQEARSQLGLDRVVLMPVSAPPHKHLAEDPGPEERLELCRLAAEGEEDVVVWRLEIDRGGPSFTVDTLREVHERSPEHELTFIVGGDVARGLRSWREPEEVLRLAVLAVAEREEVRRRDVADDVAGLAGSERVVFFDMPRIDVSSTEIRERLRTGRPVRHLVPEAVARAVDAHGYYRQGVRA